MPSSIFVRIITAVLGLTSVLHAGVVYTAAQGDTVVPNQYLVRLKPGVDPSLITQHIAGATIQALRALNLHIVTLPRPQPGGSIADLGADPLVEYVEPNHLRTLNIATPNDPQYANQWALQTIQAYQAWGVLSNSYLTSATANNLQRITIAVIDTGADCTHPDFMNAGGTSTDAAQGGQFVFSLSQAFYPTTINNAACIWQDDYGHGTHVAGIVGAATNNNTGIASLGYMLQIAAYKGLSSAGSGDDGLLANAIMAAADAGIRVVSASWGSGGYSQAMQDAVTYAWQRNTMVVAAAGNSGNSTLFFPAGAAFAVGVAATDSSNNPANFSNFGDHIRVAAPGVGIYSTMPTYSNPMGSVNYGSLSGTSMSTPFVSALAGLLWTQSPTTSAAAVLQRIQQSAVSNNVNGGWGPSTGYGIINAYDAVSGTLRTASLGALTGQVTDGNGNLIAAQLTAGIQTATADSSGLYRFPALSAGTYTVTVSANGYPTLTVSATVAAGADTILPIILGASYGQFTGTVTHLGNPVPGAIVQAVSQGLIQSTAVADTNGTYHLWVTPPGTYNIVASALLSNNTIVTGASVSANGSDTVNLAMTSPNDAGTVVVTTAPAGLSVVVDGTTYTAPVSFSWIAGSSHTLDTSATQGGSGTQYLYTTWNNSSTKSQTVIAGGPATFTATFKTQYLLTTSVSAGGGGTVSPATGYYDASSQVPVTATPSSGYQFTSFSGDVNGTTNPITVSMSSPRAVAANFVAVANVTVATSPSSLSVTVDGITYTSPHVFTWTLNSTHTLDTTSPQTSGSTQNVFSQWNDTATKSRTITVTGSTTYTASFVTQYLLTTTASPGAGGSISPPTGFFNAGSVVTVTATTGPGNQFTGFSGDLSGTTNPQTITLSAPRSVTANFVGASIINVTTSPAGLSVTVDGTALTAPQSFTWVQGSVHTIDTTATQGSGSTHSVFTTWNNTSTKSQNITVAGAASYTATFKTQYLLTTAVNPGAGGNISPGSGYFDAGSTIPVSENAASGYSFTGYSGDLSGTATPQSVTMSAPRSVTANFSPAYAITITTSPASLSVIVDGITYSAPHTVTWQQGSSHTLDAALTQGSGSSQNVFLTWNNTANKSQTVIANSSGSYTAYFKTQYLLTTGVSPASSGSVNVPTAYYDSGSTVPITATPAPGYQFANYSGDLSGATNPQSVLMNAARNVTANFGCAYSLGSSTTSVTSSGFSGSVTVSTAQGCHWTAVSNSPWLAITNGGSGTGSGSVTYSAALNTGIARSGVLTISGATFTVAQAGSGLVNPDFDNNGSADLVWQSESTRQVTVHYYGGAGGAVFQSWNYLNVAGSPGWHVAAVADFNGDGVPDLVWQNDATRQVTVHYYGGAGGASFIGWNYLNSTGAPGWTVVAAADFNGDGTPDLVWLNDTTRQVTVNYYGGTGGATMTGWNYLNAAGAPGWRVAAAADFNGDGVPDLVWQNDATRQVTVHYYGGAGGAIYQSWNWLDSTGKPGWAVRAATDVNRDGTPDLIWQDDIASKITVFYYGGNGGAVVQGSNVMNANGAPGWNVVN